MQMVLRQFSKVRISDKCSLDPDSNLPYAAILSRTLRKSGNHNSIYAVILSEVPAQICHPNQARSAQWKDL